MSQAKQDTTMHDNPLPNSGTNPPEELSVEDRWYTVLTAHGADGELAERLLQSFQAHPELAFGDPSVDRVQQLTVQAINEFDLIANGPATDADEAHQIQAELKDALLKGLNGDIPGPISLTMPHAMQDAGRHDAGTIEDDAPEPTATSPTRGDRAQGFAYRSPNDLRTDRINLHDDPASDESPDAELSRGQAREQIHEALEVLTTVEVRSLLETELATRDEQSNQDEQ